ncbi:MAG: nicotinate-nucleotide diphosphorylase, partial [Pseudomonadales bacterium]
PGLRLAQQYAVATGGAANHRLGLFDAYLIKENHIQAAGSIGSAIAKAKSAGNKLRVEVEVESLAELDEALAANPDWIMLDNLSLADLQTAVSRAKGTGIKLEASGGIDSAKALRAIAETGVDYISMGALTKQPRAIDLSMRFSKA